MAGSSPAMTSEGSENPSPSKTFVEDGVMADLIRPSTNKTIVEAVHLQTPIVW